MKHEQHVFYIETFEKKSLFEHLRGDKSIVHHPLKGQKHFCVNLLVPALSNIKVLSDISVFLPLLWEIYLPHLFKFRRSLSHP